VATSDNPPPATPPADPPAGLEQRLGKVEQTQTEQGGKLDKIIGLLAGDEQVAHGEAQDHVESKLDRSSRIKDLVTAAVKDVGAEQAAEAERARHAAEHERLAAPPADPVVETPPREPTRKEKLQTRLFGGQL
jgi:hypothetical protein